MRILAVLFAASVCSSSSSSSSRAPSNPIAAPAAVAILGHARITVLSAWQLRIEFSRAFVWSDAATPAVVNRRLPVPEFTTSALNASAWRLTTAQLTLIYNDAACVAGGGLVRDCLVISAPVAAVAWTPGDTQRGNLNGTLQQMDCYTTPGECYDTYRAGLQPGLLARDGWSTLDDSTAPLLVPDAQRGGQLWWEPAPANRTDLYFSVYGDDLRGALARASDVLGPPGLLPRAMLGPWWSQNYDFDNITGSNRSIVTAVLDEYGARGIPLSVLVLDMVRSPAAGAGQVADTYKQNDTPAVRCLETDTRTHEAHYLIPPHCRMSALTRALFPPLCLAGLARAPSLLRSQAGVQRLGLVGL